MLARSLVAALAGVVLSFAFEPVAVAYVMPFTLAAYALCTRELRSRAGFVVGLAFGVGFYFPHIYWMSPSIGLPAWLALAATEAFFYGVLGALSPILQRLRAWPAWLAAAWVAMETIRATWPFSGMPWGRLGFGVVDTPFAPALAYVGVNGVSLLVAVLGFLLARLVTTPRGDERLFTLGSVVLVTAASVVPALVPWTLATTGETTVAAVQGDVPGRGNDVLFDIEQLTQNHVDATVDLADRVAAGESPRPDFVVWPENSTARDPFEDATINAGITRAVEAIGVPVLVGGIVDAGPDHVLNQGIVWDPETGAGDRYAKRHPVAYGEYIPLRDHLPDSWVNSGQLARIPRDMLSGSRSTPLTIAGVDVADSICFDIAYDDGIKVQVDNGAEILAVQTSNASFIFTDQIEQQFAITRARAIESGRYVVVAATNGVSGVIAPDGSVVDRTQRRTQDVVVETVELKSGTTPGLGVGEALRAATPWVTVVGVVWGIMLRRRKPTASAQTQPTAETEDQPA
ncbi:apolipoprotein N-acyltransferase [Nocardioides sp.]|uniref:apolipoprotein N-acyltransferase n=1 Tax=Nocardioides sp. TaxID=35761 RepID=UPI002722A06D|nr:apolipoprotein N-acyltransferase [Nocardioides sp.]MDO9454545.1 apolipoprotein N-acyltransferase [Nocardioides sp.]